MVEIKGYWQYQLQNLQYHSMPYHQYKEYSSNNLRELQICKLMSKLEKAGSYMNKQIVNLRKWMQGKKPQPKRFLADAVVIY